MPGFLQFVFPTRASLMLDVVFVAMFLVVPLMAWGINLAKMGKFRQHKQVQLTLAIILLVAVGAFEVDMRFFTDWEQLAKPSTYYESGWVHRSLYIHLAFAIPTLLLWIVVTVGALRNFPTPLRPAGHSHLHKKLGKLAAVGMTGTAVTGWIFYYLGFIA
jgi:putative membrane protein